MKLNGKKIGFVLGIFLFVLFIALPVPQGMNVEAWRLAAVTILMAVFWVTEALPVPATALLPIVFYPIFGIMRSPAVTASYGDNIIYLFLGGFFLAATMEKWNLHRRIALNIIRLTGTTPSKMVLGFFAATLLLSMFVSNTACAVMMVPIAIAVAKSLTGKASDPASVKKESNFSKSLLLTVAYASTIGGITTIIATPANGIAVSILRETYGLNVTFVQWMMIGVPLALVMSAFVWFMLTKVLFRTGDLKLLGGREVIEEELQKLGKMTAPEKRVLFVAGLMVFCWITRGLLQNIERVREALPILDMLTDTQISIGGTILMFLIPAKNEKKDERLLDWPTAVKIPWGICLLFGGGIAIARAFDVTGLASWISGNLASINGLTLFTAVLISTAVVCCLTEITSNTAIASLFIPIMGATAIALGVHPFATVMAICFSSSMCFAMPVATPPNAIAYSSGYIKIKDMAYAGLILNFVTIIMVFSTIMWLLPLIWGVDLTVTPQSVLDFMAH